jgi:hypothetical protein
LLADVVYAVLGVLYSVNCPIFCNRHIPARLTHVPLATGVSLLKQPGSHITSTQAEG